MPAVDAAGAVDAQNAPTAPWKTAQNAVSHSDHTLIFINQEGVSFSVGWGSKDPVA